MFSQGEDWWEKAGKTKKRASHYIGLRVEVAEIFYQKYMCKCKYSRLHLWLLLSWMRQYPHRRRLEQLLPRGYHLGGVRIWRAISGLLKYLNTKLVEVTPAHARHPNNQLPHFPGCVGSVDTYPVRVHGGPRRYAPKYKAPVMKLQVATSHLGFIMFISGPHVGADSAWGEAKTTHF